MNWPVFFKRLGSAIVFSAIMMLGLLGNSPWGIFALAIAIQFLCLREFYRLCALIFPQANFPTDIYWLLQLWGLAVMITVSLADISFAALAVVPVLLLALAVLRKKTALEAGLASLVGLLYIAFPLTFLVWLWHVDFALPLALILMIWMNDTMAYIVGSFIGRTPFSPISPKKTWEGTAGGAILTIVGAVIWAHYAPRYSAVDWMMLAACATVAGTAGDLFESKLKRMANVKDSGTLMPGHGGALDRFDSLLFALPFAYVYVLLFMAQ